MELIKFSKNSTNRGAQQATVDRVAKGRTQLSDYHSLTHTTLTGLPRWLSGKEPTCQAEEEGSTPGLEGSPGEVSGNPLQYSCLRHPMDRGAWWATVHGVAKRHDLVTKQQQHLQIYSV